MKLKKFNFKVINSTNDTAIRLIKNLNHSSGIIIADQQKKGRGQYGNNWKSFKGNLFLIIFFNLDKINLSLANMTKINCQLIKKLLTHYYKKNITIKKPNDLLIKKKKISGILQETLVKSGKTFIIVGIGINLVKSPKIRNYPTTNLLTLTRTKIKKKYIILKLIKIYEKFITKFSNLNLININKV